MSELGVELCIQGLDGLHDEPVVVPLPVTDMLEAGVRWVTLEARAVYTYIPPTPPTW